LKIIDKNGEIILESTEIAVKIASNRDIYLKKPSDREFKSSFNKIPLGKSAEEKVLFAMKLRLQYLQKLQEDSTPTGDDKEKGEKSPNSPPEQ
jgi:hypothetical protein